MTPAATRGQPIKVGVIVDQTGPLSFVGLANANVARMVTGDINAKGGLLGRPLELYLEDSATDDRVAAERAAKLVEHASQHTEWEEFSRLRLSEGGDLRKYYPLSDEAMAEYVAWRDAQKR